MYFNEDQDFDIDFFDEEDYEENQTRASAKLHQNTIKHLENRYQCSYPEFILYATSKDELSDLLYWTLAIRYLARYDEKIYV